MVKIFRGKEIDKNQIKILKDIAYRRYDPKIYNEYFSDLNDVKDLAYLHDVSIDKENLVIGTDWFLCYTESEYHIQISEWVSIDNDEKIKQIAEMMSVLKKIFIQNKEKLFIADMRHDTSYAIYSKMLQRGYFKEINHKCIIDCASPSQVDDLKTRFMDKFSSIEEFLASDESNKYSKYFKYILHHLSFLINDKFVKKYINEPIDTKRKLLKKKKQEL